MPSRGRHLYPVDILVAGYALFTLVVFILIPSGTTSRGMWIAFDIAVLILVGIMSRINPDERKPLIKVLRLFYPAFLFVFFYEQTGAFVFALFDRWFDGAIIAAEEWLFGFQPAIVVEKLYHPILNEVIIGSYISYYIWLPVALVLFLRYRKQEVAYRLLTASTIAFFCSYIIFMLYPAEGPRHFQVEMFGESMSGFLFVPLARYVMENAAVHGGAMPSSHTAVALIIWIFALRERRLAGWLIFPILLGLMTGCVWGRFHYLLDVVAGVVIGLSAILLTDRLFASGRLGASRFAERIDRQIVRTKLDSTRSL